MRREKLENLVTIGNFDGKKVKGRPGDKHLDDLSAWHNWDKKST